MKNNYFSKLNEELALSKSDIIDLMKESGLSEMDVFLPKRVEDADVFFCRAVNQVGIKGNGYDECGKWCVDYKPKNGKSGCCMHYGFCYEPGEPFLLRIDGKITPIKIG